MQQHWTVHGRAEQSTSSRRSDQAGLAHRGRCVALGKPQLRDLPLMQSQLDDQRDASAVRQGWHCFDPVATSLPSIHEGDKLGLAHHSCDSLYLLKAQSSPCGQ